MDCNSAEVAFHALGRIFWGVLICVLDFSLSFQTNGEGFKLDVISDVIGAFLIARGIGQLRPLVFDAQYARIMGFCGIVAILAVLDAIADHLILPWPMPVRALYGLWSIVCLYAVYRFCGAMRILCFAATLFDTEATWITSERLALWLVLIPGVAMQVLGLAAAAAPPSQRVVLGPLALAAVIAAVIALIQLLLSIARTRTALRDIHLARFLP